MIARSGRLSREDLCKLALVSAGAAAAAAVVAGSVVARKRLLRFEVEGLSMVPALGPGDRVLVLRTDHISVGDIVALRQSEPDDPTDRDVGHVTVKRVTGVERNSVRVEGDNSSVSRDSRHFGPLPRSAIIGKVLWCYWSPYHDPTGAAAAAAGAAGGARPRRASSTLRNNAGGALKTPKRARRHAAQRTRVFDR